MNDELSEEVDGHQRWLVATRGDVSVKERLPLHVLKMEREQKEWFIGQIARKLRRKLDKKAALSLTSEG